MADSGVGHVHGAGGALLIHRGHNAQVGEGEHPCSKDAGRNQREHGGGKRDTSSIARDARMRMNQMPSRPLGHRASSLSCLLSIRSMGL
jgi:hypothetical protein